MAIGDSRGIREGMHAYANEFLRKQMESGLYDNAVFAAALGLTGNVVGQMGNDAATAIGKKLSAGEMQKVVGGTTFQGFFQTEKGTGGKYVGYNSTGPDAGADRKSHKKKSYEVAWTERADPLAIPNDDIKAADKGGPLAFASCITDAWNITAADQLEAIATSLYTGVPSAYGKDKFDNIVGLQEWIHDSNTMCGIDRSLAANEGFRGVRSTAALPCSLSLLDDIHLKGVDDGAAGTTQSLFNKSSKANLIITTNTNYAKLKQEALSRQLGELISGNKGGLPQGGMVGFMGEYINYNGKVIVADPYCPANHLFMLDSNTWSLQFRDMYKLTPLQNLREVTPGVGADDITTGELCTEVRLICTQPWKNFQGTNVS